MVEINRLLFPAAQGVSVQKQLCGRTHAIVGPARCRPAPREQIGGRRILIYRFAEADHLCLAEFRRYAGLGFAMIGVIH